MKGYKNITKGIVYVHTNTGQVAMLRPEQLINAEFVDYVETQKLVPKFLTVVDIEVPEPEPVVTPVETPEDATTKTVSGKRKNIKKSNKK